IDDFNREALGIEIDFSLPSDRVIRALRQIISWRGKPSVIRCDNGPENISSTITKWAKDWGIHLEYIQPGNPQQNAYVERLNRTVRYEWLSQYHWADLDVVSHDVVPREAKARSGGGMFSCRMWAAEVVVEHPGREFAGTYIRVGIDIGVSPFTQQRLNEPLGLAVGARGVRPGALVLDPQTTQQLGKAFGSVGRSVIRHH